MNRGKERRGKVDGGEGSRTEVGQWRAVTEDAGGY
jgi:hypothetical protein